MRRLILENSDGSSTALPYEMVYGCAMRRIEKDGVSGIQCESFLVGGLKNLKLYELENPMSASIARILEQMGKEDGDPVMEALTSILIRHIGIKLITIAGGMEVEHGSKE